jgi:hypothetical protein
MFANAGKSKENKQGTMTNSTTPGKANTWETYRPRLRSNTPPTDTIQRAVAGYEIKEREVSSVTVAVTPSKNTTGSTQPVPTPPFVKCDDPAYIGNIATIARGKDKDIPQIADQYEHEAFNTPADAARRFALVVGVNNMETASEEQAPQMAQIQGEVNKTTNVTAFPTGAIGHLWRPKWVRVRTNTEVDVQDVRNAISRGHDPAALKVAAKEEERKKRNLKNAPNIARNNIMKSIYTRDLLTHMHDRFNDVYIHVGDPDAVNLKAPDIPDATPARPATPLLGDRYDRIIGGHSRQHGHAPAVVTGGYRFRHIGEGDIDPRAAGPDADKAKVKAKSLQTVKSSELDMLVREQVAEINPGVPYWPEPNLILSSSIYRAVASGTKEPFGAANVESVHLRNQLRDTYGTDWLKTNTVFNRTAALYTDAGRFDDPYSTDPKADPKFKTGKLSKDELTSGKAKQSHAKAKALGEKSSATYGLHKNAAVSVYENIFTSAGPIDATNLKTYINSITMANKPTSIPGLLAHFRAQNTGNILNISDDIVLNLLNEIPAKTKGWIDAIDIAMKATRTIAIYKAAFTEATG